MSTPFAEPAGAREIARLGLVAVVATLVAACSASAPRQTTSAAPEIATPAAADETAAEIAPPSSPADPVPEAAQLAYDRAIRALESQDWLAAELELEQLARDFPAFPGPHVNLAIVYQHDGRRDEARAALARALEISPGNAAANNQLGILLRTEGKFEDAERAYRRALEGDPGYPLAHYNLAVLLDVYLRRGGEAIPHYEAYQSSRSEPDKTVAGWLIDLRRRFGGAANVSQAAREDGA